MIIFYLIQLFLFRKNDIALKQILLTMQVREIQIIYYEQTL